MIAIPINSPKYGLKYFFIDGEDFVKVKEYTWWLNYSKHTDSFYIDSEYRNNKKRVKIKLHRYLVNCPKGMVVDHIDGNTLNNCRSNLRICKLSENSRNRRDTPSSSIYKGVFLIKRDNVYTAAIRYKNNLIYLGRFKNEVNAAKAYNEAAIKYFGEFARLNVITEDVLPEKPRKYSSTYRGVSFDLSRNKFTAYFQKDKKNIFLGRFNTELEAAMAYNNACDRYGVPERKNIFPEAV